MDMLGKKKLRNIHRQVSKIRGKSHALLSFESRLKEMGRNSKLCIGSGSRRQKGGQRMACDSAIFVILAKDHLYDTFVVVGNYSFAFVITNVIGYATG